MTDDHHHRESDRYKTWHKVVIWATALGGIPAVVTAAVIIWNSAAGAVHANDYIKSIPCMQKQIADHEDRIGKIETGMGYIKESLDRLLDAQGIDRPEEKDERTGH